MKIMIIMLVVVVVIPSVLLYFISRNYYYERNMSRYAMGVAYLEVKDSFSSFAYCIRTNTSTLARTIMENVHTQESVDLLAYMDPPNHQLWWRLSSVFGELQTLAQIDFFPNGSGLIGVKPEKVYSYVLDLNDTITQAEVSMQYTDSASDYIYNPDGNLFQLNQTKLLEMDDIGRQFLSSVMPP